MTYLALDPATRTGWACGPGLNAAGAVQLTGQSHGEKLACLYDWLDRMLDAYPFDCIAFEDAGFASVHRETAAFHGELRGIILLFAERHGLATIRVNPSSLKKWATGNGRADKRQMIQALSTMFGIATTDADEADAIWILKYAEAHGDRPTTKMTKRRRVAAAKKEARLFR